MPAAKKSNSSTKTVKTTKTTSKKQGKLARFFSKPKHVMLAVFVFIFAVFGSYQLYFASAATQYKYPYTVYNCSQTGVVLGQGNYGECVKTIQKALNRIKVVYNHSWPTLAEDKNFGSQTTAAVKGYQERQAITADGVVGPNTWSKLVATCKVSTIELYCRGTAVVAQ